MTVYSSRANRAYLRRRGIGCTIPDKADQVRIPRQATTSPARKAIEHDRGFRKLVKWRTGCEGRISYLRGYGWDRTRLDGRQGAAI